MACFRAKQAHCSTQRENTRVVRYAGRRPYDAGDFRHCLYVGHCCYAPEVLRRKYSPVSEMQSCTRGMVYQIPVRPQNSGSR